MSMLLMEHCIFNHMLHFSLVNINNCVDCCSLWLVFSLGFSQTRSSWPLLSLLPCQLLLPPRLQRSPHCLLQSWFSQQQQTWSASSHITGGPVKFKWDQRQPGVLSRNQQVPRLQFPGRRSGQHVSVCFKNKWCGLLWFHIWNFDLMN